MTKRPSYKRFNTPAPARRMTLQRTMFDCEADVLEGLESFARDEIFERLGKRVKLERPSRPDTLRFLYTGDLDSLLDLRSVTAVYLVERFAVPRPRALLGHQHFERILATIATIRAIAPLDSYRTLRLSAAGENSSVLNRFKTELAARAGLTAVAGEADLLLRLRRAADAEGWEVLIRISPRPLATRSWRVCNLPGAMNATLAYAMMRLSLPSPDDTVINVACGSGTLLVERLLLGPARSMIGCDIDQAALDCARANLQAAGFDDRVRLERWDAGQLPLPDGCANVLCSDLPFGQLVGSHQENEALYPRILAEATRIVAPGGRMLLLTHEVRLLERLSTAVSQQWRLEEMIRVQSGGMTPRIYLFRRSL